VLAVPVFVAIGLLAPATDDVLFLALAAPVLAWEAATAVPLLRGTWNRVPLPGFLAVDVVIMAAATALTGGGDSPVALAVLLTMPAVALVLCVAWTLGVLGGVALTTGAVVLADPGGLSAAWWVAWAFVAVTSALASGVRSTVTVRLMELATERRDLLHGAVGAEWRERRRLAQQLHDGVLQPLLTAGQDLREGDPDGGAALLRDATDEVRETVEALHPAALPGGGLADALRQAAARAGRRGALRTILDLEHVAPGPHDELLLAVGRELLDNAVEHARAAEVRVHLTDRGAQRVLVVADDGIGLPPGRPLLARREGLIGLAAIAERLAAAGGHLELDGAPGAGTRIEATVPCG
jgi:signal transduction histidine kinase